MARKFSVRERAFLPAIHGRQILILGKFKLDLERHSAGLGRPAEKPSQDGKTLRHPDLPYFSPNPDQGTIAKEFAVI